MSPSTPSTPSEPHIKSTTLPSPLATPLAMSPALFNKDAMLDSTESWPAWELNIKYILGEDAWKQVVAPVAKPEEDLAAAEWKRDRQAATSVLIQSIKTEHSHLLNKCGYDPHEMYTALKNHFQPDSNLDKVSLIKQYFALKLTSASSTAVDDFLRAYEKQLNMLRQHNIDIKDEWISSAHLLSTLPAEFNTLGSIVGNLAALPKVDELIFKIRAEARHINKEDPAGASIALAAAPTFQGPQSKRLPPRECPGCKKGFHWLIDCKHPDGIAYRKKKKEKYPTAAAAVNESSVTSQALLAPSKPTDKANNSGYAWIASHVNRSGAYYIDSGCTWSIVGNRRLLSDVQPIPLEEIKGIGGTIKATECGTLCLQVTCNRWITLSNVRVCEGLPVNLISVQQLNSIGFNVDCGDNANVYDQVTRKTVFTAPRIANGLYQLQPVSGNPASAYSAATLTTWHHRLCHLNTDYIRTLARDGTVEGLDFKTGTHSLSCTDCLAGKAHKMPFPSSCSRASAPLELVHCDLLSFGVPSVSGSNYLLTIIDDYSRKLFVYPIARKSNTHCSFMHFKATAELSTGLKLKAVRSDNGGEFSGKEWETTLGKAGVRHDYSVAYNPQQNGRAERPNRTILDAVRTMLLSSGLPPSLWAEAAVTLAYTKNRSPHKALGREGVPESLFTGQPCSVAHLRPFGCRAWNYINNHQREKLDPTASPLVMVGYAATSKAWRLMDPLTYKITLGYHVKFQEDIFPCKTSTATHTPASSSGTDIIVLAPPVTTISPEPPAPAFPAQMIKRLILMTMMLR
ncbi:hypothetical protein CBS101457_004918 [Exobasidium rhododendri]|nr:hypothetical protein CBS101457_004918 [Exobasidium rhododendri]